MRGVSLHHQNPSRLNPITGAVANAERRAIVLQYMYEQKKITKAQQEEALADDVYSRIQNVDAVKKESVNPYSYFTDELIEQVIQDLMEKLDYTKSQASNLLYSGWPADLHDPGPGHPGHCGRGDQQPGQL